MNTRWLLPLRRVHTSLHLLLWILRRSASITCQRQDLSSTPRVVLILETFNSPISNEHTLLNLTQINILTGRSFYSFDLLNKFTIIQRNDSNQWHNLTNRTFDEQYFSSNSNVTFEVAKNPIPPCTSCSDADVCLISFFFFFFKHTLAEAWLQVKKS